MGTIFNQISRSDMNEIEISFRMTKKEANFAFQLPKFLQNEFEVYMKQKYKFDNLLVSFSKMTPYSGCDMIDNFTLDNDNLNCD